MVMNIELLLNKSSNNLFLMNAATMTRQRIPIRAKHLFTDMFGKQVAIEFDDLKSLNKYVSERKKSLNDDGVDPRFFFAED